MIKVTHKGTVNTWSGAIDAWDANCTNIKAFCDGAKIECLVKGFYAVVKYPLFKPEYQYRVVKRDTKRGEVWSIHDGPVLCLIDE